MTAHLLALTVGPVQEFIAAARRTRDLWFGSYLLSELSKAAAKAVRDEGGTLIFPAPFNAEDLCPGSQLNVANVIVAELKESDPAHVALKAKEAARSHWCSFADRVFREYQGVIRSDIWKDQVDDVIEFYAAWHTYSPSTYKQNRAALMRLLDGRKRCRDFPPAKGRRHGIPKSSLDGLRESVLRDPKDWPERSRRPLRLREGEQLDVVGMVKRTWTRDGKAARYPSVSRVAADPWLRGVPKAHLAALRKACGDLGSDDVLHELDLSEDRGHPHYEKFPFEGTAVFRSRHHELCEDAELLDSELKPLTDALKELTHDYGEPNPYLGVVVADGDYMGQAISSLSSSGDHRAFSQALSGFAVDARRIVDEHYGVLVYAGGDDVLAFVPVDRCLACSRALHDSFGAALESWSAKTGAELTLSVGLAIAHFMEPLEDLLGYGRAAEKHAKRARPEDLGQCDRNGFAVHVVKRGGGPIAVRANWQKNPGGHFPDEHLTHLAALIASEAISSRVAYDMYKIADVYESWPPASVKDAIQRDTLSIMQGKRPTGESRMGEIESLIRARVADTLRGLAKDLLVARQIAAAIRQASAGAAIAAASP